MSGGLEVLSLKEEDVTKMLAAETHIGAENVDFQMEQYVYKRRPDGVNIINLRRTWEKLMLAARAVVAIEHPPDIFVISSKPYGQRAVLKFASYTGATPLAGRFTPGAFTNQIQAAFREPRLLIVADPRIDHQPITEASYVNIPVIAFTNTDSPLRFVDLAIPGNNKSKHSIGLMWWLLSREVLRLRGTISREMKWDIMPDLFFYRDPDEAEKEEQAKEAAPVPEIKEPVVPAPQPETWVPDIPVPAPEPTNWADDQTPMAGGMFTAATVPTAEDWSAQAAEEWETPTPTNIPAPAAVTPAPETSDWGSSTVSNWT